MGAIFKHLSFNSRYNCNSFISMSRFIEINDLSSTKDEDVDNFLNDSSVFGNKSNLNLSRLETDADFDDLFTTLVKEKQPDTFSEFQEQVGTLFKNKLDDRLER